MDRTHSPLAARAFIHIGIEELLEQSAMYPEQAFITMGTGQHIFRSKSRLFAPVPPPRNSVTRFSYGTSALCRCGNLAGAEKNTRGCHACSVASQSRSLSYWAHWGRC